MFTTRNQEAEYFKQVLSTFVRQDLTASTPCASVVLNDLMQLYISECESIISNRTHKASAQKCIDTIKLNIGQPEDEIIKQAFAEIDKTTTLTTGSFTKLLSTFFSIYPQHLATRPTTLQAKITRTDFWSNSLPTWIQSFMAAHRNHKDKNHYEMLANISKIVPDSMADTFADFLLAQLDPKAMHPSKKPGLYKGWVCIALREIIDKISPIKKEQLSVVLLKQMEICVDAGSDISLIGITSALTKATRTPKETTAITDALFNYVTNHLSDLRGLFADHHPEKIKQYMPIIFETLAAFQAEYNPLKRSTIVDLLLLNENFYALRYGIAKLSSQKWLSEIQERKLLSIITENDKLHLLLPVFWHVIDAATNNTPLRKHYDEIIGFARKTLTAPLAADALPLASSNILAFDKTITYQERFSIIDNMMTCLARYNEKYYCDDLRKDLHQALADLACGKEIEAPQGAKMAQLFAQAAMPETCDKLDVRVSAAKAACKLRAHLSDSQAKTLRDHLLELVYEDKNNDAAEALEIFAKNSAKENLPELMTTLSVMNNKVASRLLAHVYIDFQSKKWTNANTPTNQDTAPKM
jgi:hypothetical protein